MKTINETRVDKTPLHLVDTGKSFVGLAIVGDIRKLTIEGATPRRGLDPAAQRGRQGQPEICRLCGGSEPVPSILPERLPLQWL
jgi:hypothetical protein